MAEVRENKRTGDGESKEDGFGQQWMVGSNEKRKKEQEEGRVRYRWMGEYTVCCIEG